MPVPHDDEIRASHGSNALLYTRLTLTRTRYTNTVERERRMYLCIPFCQKHGRDEYTAVVGSLNHAYQTQSTAHQSSKHLCTVHCRAWSVYLLLHVVHTDFVCFVLFFFHISFASGANHARTGKRLWCSWPFINAKKMLRPTHKDEKTRCRLSIQFIRIFRCSCFGCFLSTFSLTIALCVCEMRWPLFRQTRAHQVIEEIYVCVGCFLCWSVEIFKIRFCFLSSAPNALPDGRCLHLAVHEHPIHSYTKYYYLRVLMVWPTTTTTSTTKGEIRISLFIFALCVWWIDSHFQM